MSARFMKKLFRSIAFNKNSSDNSIESCGTPHKIVSSTIFSSLLILRNCSYLINSF